jgi:hypothetical protein
MPQKGEEPVQQCPVVVVPIPAFPALGFLSRGLGTHEVGTYRSKRGYTPTGADQEPGRRARPHFCTLDTFLDMGGRRQMNRSRLCRTSRGRIGATAAPGVAVPQPFFPGVGGPGWAQVDHRCPKACGVRLCTAFAGCPRRRELAGRDRWSRVRNREALITWDGA